MKVVVGEAVSTELRTGQHVHLAEFDPATTLPLLCTHNYRLRIKKRREFQLPDGTKYLVKIDSLRYHTFLKSTNCACCGIEGTKLMLDRQPHDHDGGNTAHFNLYAVLPDGSLLLMTKDHKVASAKGGRNGLGNLQTMCTLCNNKKGDRDITIQELRKEMGFEDYQRGGDDGLIGGLSCENTNGWHIKGG